MAARSEVRLLVNETEFLDAIDWSIESDMMTAADAFSVSVANPYGRTIEKVARHDSVKVMVDGTVQMTGWVDDLNLSGSAGEGARIEVVGRDRFGQLIDVSAKPKSYTDQDMQQIAFDLSRPFVTRWHVDNEDNRRKLAKAKRKVSAIKGRLDRWFDDEKPSASWFDDEEKPTQDQLDRKALAKAKANLALIRATVFPRIKVDPGESPMEVIQRMAEKVEMLVWQAADGSGVIARPNYSQQPRFQIRLHPSTLDTARDNNVKSWQHTLSGRELFASMKISSTSANTAKAYGAASHHNVHTWFDDEVAQAATAAARRRRARLEALRDEQDAFQHGANVGDARWKLISGSGQNRAQATKELERQKQLAKFNAVTLGYTVQGHMQNGLLWQVDSLVAVDDKVNNVSGDYYLTSRRFVGSKGGGQTTELVLHPKGILLP